MLPRPNRQSARRARLSPFVALAVVLGAVWAWMAASAKADGPIPVRLLADPVTQGEVITLGDVFQGVGAAQDWRGQVIAPAPPPGGSAVFDPIWLQYAAADAGVSWTNPGDVKRVWVRTAAQTISPETLTNVIAAALVEKTGDAWTAELFDPRARHAPLGVAADPKITGLDWDAATNRFSANVQLTPGGPAITVTGRAARTQAVAVLVRSVQRGERIRIDDVRSDQRPAREIPAGALDVADLVGMAARRSLRAGQIVRSADVAAPPAVRRGDPAMLVFQSGRLTLTAKARALENAAVGEPARFVSGASGRTVEAVVDAPGRARVSAGFRGGW